MRKIEFRFDQKIVWHSKKYEDMSAEERDLATKEWRAADESGATSSGNPADTEIDEVAVGIQSRMYNYMTKDLKWTQKELHDAFVIAGMSTPETPSMLNYFTALHRQFGDDKLGFLPQNRQSHTKKRIQTVLRCMARNGLKLGGRLTDNKDVLAGRLSHWLNTVLEAGRNVPPQEGEDCVGDGSGDASDAEQGSERKPRNCKQLLVEHTGGPADVPPDAIVTPEQAESALGHVQATDHDADVFDTLDEDQKEEEMALMGRVVNPPLDDYDCISWSPDRDLAKTMGWHPGLPFTPLSAADFTCTGEQVRAVLEGSLASQKQRFVKEMTRLMQTRS